MVFVFEKNGALLPFQIYRPTPVETLIRGPELRSELENSQSSR